MGLDILTTEHERECHKQSEPAAFGKFGCSGDEQNDSRKQQTEAVDAQPVRPSLFGPSDLPPVSAHAQLGQSES